MEEVEVGANESLKRGEEKRGGQPAEEKFLQRQISLNTEGGIVIVKEESGSSINKRCPFEEAKVVRLNDP